VITRYPIHSTGRHPGTANEIAAPDYESDLHAGGIDRPDLSGDTLNHLRLDAVSTASHQGFTAELQQYTPVTHCFYFLVYQMDTGYSCIATKTISIVLLFRHEFHAKKTGSIPDPVVT
jgi:hypothetical protein